MYTGKDNSYTRASLVKFISGLKSALTPLNKANLSNLASLGIFLILCSKFYYLFGVANGISPALPKLVLIRDALVCGFLLFFGFQVRHSIPKLKLFWTMWGLGLLISLLQLWLAKGVEIWAHHYLRNVLIPLLFYPVILGILNAEIKISLRRILMWIFAANVVASYCQVFFTAVYKRPTGLFGDPIINSLTLYWGLAAVFLSGNKKQSAVAFLILLPLYQYLSSLSSILSFALGCATVLLLTYHSWKGYLKTHLKLISIVSATALISAIAISWAVQKVQPPDFENASHKARMLYQSAFCNKPGCEHWSYEGRIQSNLRPFALCKQNVKSCLIGNVQTDQYEKVESTWASLISNWGAFFCLLYLGWILTHLKKPLALKLSLSEEGKDHILWSLIFITCIYFSFLNTLFYKFPINILFYASMAYLIKNARANFAAAKAPRQ